MTAKQFLEKLEKLNEMINAKTDERKSLIELAGKTTTELNGMPHGSGVSDNVGNIAAKLADLSKETDRLIDQYVDYKKMVISAIERLPAKEYGVLHRYYIQNMTWGEVAEDMGYCEMQVYRIRSKALNDLNHVIGC